MNAPRAPRGRRVLRALGIALLAFAVTAAVGAAAAYAASAYRIGRTYDVPNEPPLRVPTDSASVARGRHLASSAGTCTLCHGDDFGGAVYADAGPLGFIAGPNLTRGRGGLGATLTDQDWERAVRHGVRRDGTSLIVMPSEAFTEIDDTDLAAIIAYARHAPPVDRELPPTRFGPMGRALIAAGKLPLLVAAKTPRVRHDTVAPRPPAAPTAAYGRYLASLGGCHGCHGFGLSGGQVGGPPGTPIASNLTPAGIGAWSEADFVRAMRAGRRPDNSPIDEFMPWRVVGRMTDDELHAIWLYLRSVPPKATGNK